MNVNLQFDAKSGVWNGLLVDNLPVAVAPAADVQVNAAPRPFPSANEWRLQAIRRAGKTIETQRTADYWQVRQVLAVSGGRIRRDVFLQWHGDEPVRIAGAYLRTPVFRLSESPKDFWLIPGDFPIRRVPIRQRKPGKVTEEVGWTRGEYGIALIHSPQRKLSVIAAYIFRMDQARVGVEEHVQGIALRHGFETLLRLSKGRELHIGSQVIEVVAGDEARLKVALSKLSDSLGNGPPQEQAEFLNRAVIYELHPWGRLESWWSGDRGNRFTRLTAQLPFLRELGVTALWLLPPGHPPPWVYTTLGFNRIAPENGTPQELGEFVRRAHRLGMKVAVDLVVYGVHPDSEEVRQLPPEVWCVDEEGNRAKVWSDTVLAADVSHPAWQERIRTVVTQWAKAYGFDGARLDVAGWGQSANWRNPHRANASVAYGGLQLNKVVRDAFRAVTRDGFILPEAGKPLAFRHADLLFDYPWYMVMRDVTVQPDLARWIREAQEWLEWERHCYPRRLLNGLVRFLENHDTVSAAQYFGVGLSQALMAICCLMQGAPLIYQEQEVGFTGDLSQWLRLRERERCLAQGEAEYLSVQCTAPHVFTFLRRAEDGVAVVAVNLSGETVRCSLSWQSTISQRYPVCVDAFTGERVQMGSRGVSVQIAPYRPVVFLLKPRSWRPVQKQTARPTSSRPSPSRWHFREDGTVVALGAERWFVQTPEGRLEDRFCDYHTRVRTGESLVDALPVLKRAWNPLEEGLLDGYGNSSIGVMWADGQELRLTVDVARASEVRMVDERLDGRRVELVVKPREAYSLQPPWRHASPAPRDLQVTPLFVHLLGKQTTLSLSRRHGGLPVLWRMRDRRQLLFEDVDAYTDWGLVQGAYASADGETNPRLSAGEDRGSRSASFEGWLRHRAWNGVQTCPIASPGTRYRLSYTLGDDDFLKVSFGVTPLSELGQVRAFFAMRMRLRGFLGWQRGAEGGRAGESVGVRLGEGAEAPPLLLSTEGGILKVVHTQNLQNVFVIDAGDGRAVLFLALLDGKPVSMRTNAHWSGEVWMAWEK